MSWTIKLSSPETRGFWEIPVLYEDEQLLALDKPAGLWGSPDPAAPDRPNLLKLLHAGIADARTWATQHKLDYLINAHRLDAETSGVMLLARNKEVLVALADLFGADKPLLRYTALVQGAPEQDRFEVEARLAPHPARPGMMCIAPRQGKHAKTRFSVLERFSGWTLLNCEPLTLRPHQIRAHLRSVGLPVAADDLYGGKPLLLSRLKSVYRLKPGRQERPLLDRPALHAEQLTLPHPVTGEALSITAPLPKDLTVALKFLRRHAGVASDA